MELAEGLNRTNKSASPKQEGILWHTSWLELDLFSLISHAGPVCLLSLDPFVRDMISLSVLNEDGSGFDESEGHAAGDALAA